MKAAIPVFCIILSFGISALASDSPGFNGNWTRDIAQSDAMAANLNGRVEPINVNLVVTQTDEELNVESVWSYKPATRTSYSLDGDDHAQAEEGGASIIYRARMNGDQLVIHETRKVRTPFGDVDTRQKEEWALSADKAVLIVTKTTTTTELGSRTQKQVYTRQE